MGKLASSWGILACGCLLWASTGSVQADVDVNVSGVVVLRACSIRPGDDKIPLHFGSLTSEYLYSMTRTPGRDFAIGLVECDTGIADTVTVTFTGNRNPELPGLLAIDTSSNASGIAIGIETAAGNPLPLDTVSDEQAIGDGSNVIALKAYLQGEPTAIANRTIEPGAFSATSTFTLGYP